MECDEYPGIESTGSIVSNPNKTWMTAKRTITKLNRREPSGDGDTQEGLYAYDEVIPYGEFNVMLFPIPHVPVTRRQARTSYTMTE